VSSRAVTVDAAADVEAYLRDTSSSADPYPAYRRLREVAPVHRSEANGYWIVTGYQEAEALLRDRRLSRHLAGQRQFGWLAGQDDPPDIARAVTAWLSTVLNSDPPDHTRLRSLLARPFAPSAMNAWRARIDEVVDAVFDQVLVAHEVGDVIDLLSEVAYPIPETVICEVLGVPAGDHARWKQWGSGLNQAAIFAGTAQAIPAEPLRTAQQSVLHWCEYFSELVAARRHGHGDDLISSLVRIEEEGERLTEIELVGTLILIIGAGHDTTANLFANGMLALMRNPAQYELLRADPALAPAVAEEVLRFDGSARGQPRVASAAIDIDGQTIAPGDLVMIVLNAANRDPRRFADPERFDITRADQGHLAFANGIHFCLGAPLARLEVAAEFARVATLPGRFERAVDAAPDLAYKRTHGRNLVSLPARLVQG
jgi:cytochrome P450